MEEILVIAFYVFLSAFWGTAYYLERKKILEREALTSDELVADFFGDVGIQSFGFDSGFSVNQITHLSPNALPGRNYNFVGKAEAAFVPVIGGGLLRSKKFESWRTEWRDTPRMRF